MVCRPLMWRPPLLGRMFPSLGSQPRCCSRRLLGGSSVPLFSRASSRELVYCTRELAARPVRSSSLSPPLPVRTHTGGCWPGVRDRLAEGDRAF